ncbi:MAG: carboxypeptidase regulatory-like domain-containing protein [Acidobacteriaceae bacterium]
MIVLTVFLAALASPVIILGQGPMGTVQGRVLDPSGAVIPHAQVTVTSAAGKATTVQSDASGAYQVRGLPAGAYTVNAATVGFAPFKSSVTLTAGQSKILNIAMQIQTEQQQVQVEAEAPTVDTSPDQNANAVVLKGKDLDALSDDPDELENQLQALAGPAAGPNGGEIYIDGFTGGQIPPKSSIREIRVNQNPFSAEFDRLGYGRIEILTKPGTDKLHGQIEARGNDSSFNSKNPILHSGPEPPYYQYNLQGSVGGPISKKASYFVSAFGRNTQNVSVIDAIDPASITPENPAGSYLNEPYPNPSSRIDVSPRLDLQLGQSNTLTMRYEFYRAVTTNSGVGQLALPTQAANIQSMENTLQVSDSLVLSKKIVDDIRFQYRRFRYQNIAQDNSPTITVQGTFTTGGNNAGEVRDNQDIYELQNYFAAAEGNHSLNFGGRVRAYRDANFTTGGANGEYIFQNSTAYAANTPQTYQVTDINQYTARAILFDAALFYQDDWKVNQRFTFSYGLRWETQNRINDKSDWAPRISLAYALDGGGKKQPKTVLRGGYGWFYQRFTVPNSFGSNAGTPYVIQAIHQNGINQTVTTITNPTYPVAPAVSASSASAPTRYTIDPNFHAALDMQAAVGIDRQIAKRITGNLTYLYGRGVHMYYTNNVGAPYFETADLGIYPAEELPPADENNLQYQSGGVYRQNQIIVSARASYPRFSFFSFYTYNVAKADTSGVNFTPSIAQDPGLDYGRSSFDVHNRFLILGNFTLPYAFSVTPFFGYNSGTPYNVTVSSDLTRNNQFNARPAYAATSACQAQTPPPATQRYYSTAYGCLDTDPFGTNEQIIPYGLGTGPSNLSLNLRVSKVIGIGPKVEGGRAARGGGGGGGGGGGRGGGGGLGPGGLSGSRGGPGRLDQATSRRYNLTLSAYGANIFNRQNLGTPNGTLSSQNFDRSLSLAGGFFGPPSSGNRTIFLQAVFNF